MLSLESCAACAFAFAFASSSLSPLSTRAEAATPILLPQHRTGFPCLKVSLLRKWLPIYIITSTTEYRCWRKMHEVSMIRPALTLRNGVHLQITVIWALPSTKCGQEWDNL
jgi:hypothetical protein